MQSAYVNEGSKVVDRITELRIYPIFVAVNMCQLFWWNQTLKDEIIGVHIRCWLQQHRCLFGICRQDMCSVSRFHDDNRIWCWHRPCKPTILAYHHQVLVYYSVSWESVYMHSHMVFLSHNSLLRDLLLKKIQNWRLREGTPPLTESCRQVTFYKHLRSLNKVPMNELLQRQL